MSRIGGSRGRKESPPAAVNIYEILARADGPLTIFEIADRMAQAFTTNANIAYRAHRELERAMQRPVPPEGEYEAWLWWVREQLKISRENKWIFSRQEDGTSAQHIGQPPDRDKKIFYRHNPDKAPTVLWPDGRGFAAWTPDYPKIAAQQNAEVQYAELRKRYGKKTTRAQDHELLALADRRFEIELDTP